MGVLAFYDDQYKQAQQDLSFALSLFPPELPRPDSESQSRRLLDTVAFKNKLLLLSYLVPVNILAGQCPSLTLLAQYPFLDRLFGQLVDAIGKGQLGRFDLVLDSQRKLFIQRDIYLAVERCRIICFRNLVRRVFLIREKKTRLELHDVLTAVVVAGCTTVDMDEIECMVANLIDK
ncbi:PCI domain-containing protein 2, partial [Physocladia obscura]